MPFCQKCGESYGEGDQSCSRCKSPLNGAEAIKGPRAGAANSADSLTKVQQYIDQCRSKGMSDEVILKVLKEKGWNDSHLSGVNPPLKSIDVPSQNIELKSSSSVRKTSSHSQRGNKSFVGEFFHQVKLACIFLLIWFIWLVLLGILSFVIDIPLGIVFLLFFVPPIIVIKYHIDKGIQNVTAQLQIKHQIDAEYYGGHILHPERMHTTAYFTGQEIIIGKRGRFTTVEDFNRGVLFRIPVKAIHFDQVGLIDSEIAMTGNSDMWASLAYFAGTTTTMGLQTKIKRTTRLVIPFSDDRRMIQKPMFDAQNIGQLGKALYEIAPPSVPRPTT